MLRKKLTAIVLIITLLCTMTQAITVNAATNAKEVLNGAKSFKKIYERRYEYV